jgi:hypothetical protein
MDGSRVQGYKKNSKLKLISEVFDWSETSTLCILTNESSEIWDQTRKLSQFSMMPVLLLNTTALQRTKTCILNNKDMICFTRLKSNNSNQTSPLF